MGRASHRLAMANPDPEITYEDAKAAAVTSSWPTGRSDYPNQVTMYSVFRLFSAGALACATVITKDATGGHARLGSLAKQDVPDSVCRAYGVSAAEVWT